MHTKKHDDIIHERRKRYSVYFSDGHRVEIVSEGEETARALIISQYYEPGIYITRVEKLAYEEAEKNGNGRINAIRNLIFNYKE